MNSYELQRFQQAVNLAQSGQKEVAHHSLTELQQSNPNDANLLLWLAFTAPVPATARYYLEQVARIDPTNPALRQAWQWLEPAGAATPAPAYSYTQPSQPANQFQAYSQSVSQVQSQVSSSPTQTSIPATSPLQEQTNWQAQVTPQKEFTSPGKEANSSNRILVWAVGVMTVVAVLVLLVVLATQFINTDSVAAQGIPIYQGFRRLDLSSSDRDYMMKNFQAGLKAGANGNSLGSNARVSYFEGYALKNNELGPASNFYNVQLPKLGWSNILNRPQLVPRTSFTVYLKGTTWIAVVGVTGPLGPLDAPLNDPRYNVGSDEGLIFIFGIEL